MLKHAARLVAAALFLFATQSALAADPNHPLAAPDPKSGSAAQGAVEPPDDRALLASLYKRLSETEGTEAAGATAIAIERLWLISGSDTIDLLVQRALEAHEDGAKELGLRLLDNVVELAPNYAEAFVRRAYMRADGERLQEAEADLIQALAIDPNHFRAWEGLGSILQRLEQKEFALKAFRQLLEIYPANEDARRTVETLEREVEGQKI